MYRGVPMEDIWIIGAGAFGLRAAKLLTAQGSLYGVTLVDQDGAALDQAKDLGCSIEAGDGIDFLAEQLKSSGGPDWIVPAVPVHLAWEWCVRVCTGLDRRDAPPGLDRKLPNFMGGANGDVYASHADFICPPNCDEPNRICTATGHPRKQAMHEVLEGMVIDGYTSLVIQSHQLGPGLGGYRPASLFDLKDRLEKVRGPVLVGTACKCHGVISAGIATALV